ncbi:4Fe-4S binding protein, partial [Candidatus Saccharibacteria bacterium]|nr:4Fe-4S binding protein [Calditrichia bacterium]NIV73054.1 4Fe-4S binding protein [Calditrichia bacterium]NIW00320.1 4Fe-4S binding protein [Candidatus Saccharibacteria bacterium]NIW80685.1 4Fe-4S binding protein [Calditrichia bacterium]
LAVFTSTLFVGNYKITDRALQEAAQKVPAERLEMLEPIKNQQMTSKSEMLSSINKLLNADQSLSDYQLGEYKFWILKAAATGPFTDYTITFFILSIILASVGGLIYFLPKLKDLPGIKNNHMFFSSTMSRGLIGIILGIYLIGFYVLLYWYPTQIVNAVNLVEPVSQWLRNQPADRWFLYGFLYTIAVAVMGIRMFIKYRHSRYHLVRTASVIFFQFGFAFLIPTILERLNQPSMDFKNAWPLNYSFFMDWNLSNLLQSGNLGLFILFWGIVLAVIVVPVMTYFLGKRWYCSWVCGCGGLAETLGDPFRQLSDKSLRAWKIERWIVHSVLVFAVVMTVMQISNFISNGKLFADYTWRVNQAYSFLIGAAFAGV